MYKRVDDINDKVKEASLPYLEWKVLFLVGEGTGAEEISSLLGEESKPVDEILGSLESKGYIEKFEMKKEAEPVEEIIEEESTAFGDELLVDEDDTILEVEEETVEEEKIDQPVEEEVSDELPTQEESVQDAEPEQEVQEQEPAETADTPDEEQPDTVSASEFDLELDKQEESTVETVEKEADVEETIPVKEPETAAATEEEIITDVSKKTIVVIDDSIVIRKMIEIALEEEDFNIVTAISGKEGLDLIDKDKPNLVILDMMLPDMNGIDVLKVIKNEKKIPVIMLSGKDSPQLIESAKEVGVDDFLPKPFRDEDLVEKVKSLTGA